MCIYLPRHHGEIEDEGASSTLAALPRSQQDATVLVVDDEPTVRMLITDILEDLGCTAIEAGDSTAGLKILQSRELPQPATPRCASAASHHQGLVGR